MARRADDDVPDPAINVPTRTPDEWLESLRWPEPLELNVTGAELVAQARAEADLTRCRVAP